MNIPGNKRVQFSDLPSIDADVGTVLWIEDLGVKYEAVPRSGKASNAVDGPADALTPISWQPSGSVATLPGSGTAAVSRIDAGAFGSVVDGVLYLDDPSILPGYNDLLALQPRRLLLPTRRSGRTHLIDTGTDIKQWSDLSGYGLHQVQATAARMPDQGLIGLDLAPNYDYAGQQWTTGSSPIGAGGQTQWTRVYALAVTMGSLPFDNSGASKSFYMNYGTGTTYYQLGTCLRTFSESGTTVANLNLLVFVYDASQSTDALKCRVYRNGSDTPLVTSASSGSMPASLPAVSVDSIGFYYSDSTNHLDGSVALLADFPFAASGTVLTALHAACLAALETVL
jgi:hypothetical protein